MRRNAWIYSPLTVSPYLLLGKFEGEIIGKTPSNLPRSKYGETVRGDEIKFWLSIFEGSFNTENFKNKGTVNYVILDDDNDMLPEQRDNFFKTNFMLGLTEEIKESCIKFLNKY